MGVVRSAKSIIHHLSNLALYKSSFSHTANSQFPVKPDPVSNEDRTPNIKPRTVAKLTSSAPWLASCLCHLPLPCRHYLVWFSYESHKQKQKPVTGQVRIVSICFMTLQPRIPADGYHLRGWWGLWKAQIRAVIIAITTTVFIIVCLWQQSTLGILFYLILTTPFEDVPHIALWLKKRRFEMLKISSEVTRLGLAEPGHQRYLINSNFDPMPAFSQFPFLSMGHWAIFSLFLSSLRALTSATSVPQSPFCGDPLLTTWSIYKNISELCPWNQYLLINQL